MPLDPTQRIISADDHMDIHVLPPELFQERLPASLRDRGPKVIDTDDGPFWQAEGRLLSPSGRKGKGYIRSEDHGFRPGNPETRIEDMDRDGVYAHVIYSPMTTQMRLSDSELRAACMVAYNDWAAEFNRVDPDRLLLLSHIPGHDPKHRREAPRGHQRGLGSHQLGNPAARSGSQLVHVDEVVVCLHQGLNHFGRHS